MYISGAEENALQDTPAFGSAHVSEKRTFLYNGETVWVEGVFDGVKISTYSSGPLKSYLDNINDAHCANAKINETNKDAEKSAASGLSRESAQIAEGQERRSSEYISGNRAYYIPCDAECIQFDYLEFSKTSDCSETYCLSNVINNAEEVILKTEIYKVVPPVQVIEKIQGNYLIVTVIPDKSLSHEAHSKSIVSINGVRMVFKNSSYKLKLLKIPDWSQPVRISVDFEQVHYSRPSSLSLPADFMYSIGLKRVDEKYFVKLTLCRLLAISYHIVILNPLLQSSEEERAKDSTEEPDHTEKTPKNNSIIKLSSEHSVDISVLDLEVGSSASEITIDSPDAVTELLLEVRKKKNSGKVHLFAIKVNDYPIEFCIKM
ncbi:hypothetical protein NEMIN01_1367 [Nematocida minor]|uniref:uncharacterized protein n=1 Tax=Nematocida minor TaxID=1912983 RepID=UPI00221FD6A8|nr:uncharacterized protein NEMIN01_1367 [Nematocida minor]KAI5191098.1 hypothetical protein NEMIN01_1367 [Nematocida minor]